jgi:hypothetical protein
MTENIYTKNKYCGHKAIITKGREKVTLANSKERIAT